MNSRFTFHQCVYSPGIKPLSFTSLALSGLYHDKQNTTWHCNNMSRLHVSVYVPLGYIFVSCRGGVLSNNLYLIINSRVLNTRVHTHYTLPIVPCFNFYAFLHRSFASRSRRCAIIHLSPPGPNYKALSRQRRSL